MVFTYETIQNLKTHFVPDDPFWNILKFDYDTLKALTIQQTNEYK